MADQLTEREKGLVDRIAELYEEIHRLSEENRRLRREVEFEAKALHTGGAWFGWEEPERVCACVSDEQASRLGPGFARPVCSVHPTGGGA
jgi:hypothetical protein